MCDLRDACVFEAALRCVVRLEDMFRPAGPLHAGPRWSMQQVRHAHTGASGVARWAKDVDDARLQREMCVLQAMDGYVGFPSCFFSGRNNQGALATVTNSFCFSLDTRSEPCSAKTTLMIADQIIDRLEALHSRGFVHGSIQPHNIMFDDSNCLHIVDFTSATRFVQEDGSHATDGDGGNDAPLTAFSSVRAHRGRRLSRRDDLEAMIYTLIFVRTRSLPWLRGSRGSDDWYRMKVEMDTMAICGGMSASIYRILAYIRTLPFHSTPKYATMRRIIQYDLESRRLDFDMAFDWVRSAPRHRVRQNFNAMHQSHSMNVFSMDEVLHVSPVPMSTPLTDDEKRRWKRRIRKHAARPHPPPPPAGAPPVPLRPPPPPAGEKAPPAAESRSSGAAADSAAASAQRHGSTAAAEGGTARAADSACAALGCTRCAVEDAKVCCATRPVDPKSATMWNTGGAAAKSASMDSVARLCASLRSFARRRWRRADRGGGGDGGSGIGIHRRITRALHACAR
jgi:hypothetical protein